MCIPIINIMFISTKSSKNYGHTCQIALMNDYSGADRQASATPVEQVDALKSFMYAKQLKRQK